MRCRSQPGTLHPPRPLPDGGGVALGVQLRQRLAGRAGVVLLQDVERVCVDLGAPEQAGLWGKR